MPTIKINADASVEFIYTDELASLLEGAANVAVTRASHVEPAPRGGWFADMRPSGGPVLAPSGEWTPDLSCPLSFLAGFPTRQAALDAEVAWLQTHRGL